jgi:hypothetical protein
VGSNTKEKRATQPQPGVMSCVGPGGAGLLQLQIPTRQELELQVVQERISSLKQDIIFR